MNIAVVGAGAAGLAAATRAKRINPQARVVVFEAGREFSRATCSLPYYLSGEIGDFNQLQGVSQAQLAEQGIELHLETPALKIDPTGRKLETAAETLRYDKLIASTGSRRKGYSHLGICMSQPRVWDIRTIADVKKIQLDLSTGTIRKVAIVGGGYVGLEMVEALTKRGLEVTLFHRQDNLMKLDSRISNLIVEELRDHGVQVHCGCEVLEISVSPNGGRLTFRAGNQNQTSQFDAFGVCTGIEPETKLLSAAGARCGESGAVLVSERGETSLSNIYACGDGVEIPSVTGGPGRWIPLATTAARLGRVCGENAAGGSRRLGHQAGALAVRFFQSQLGVVGQPNDWEFCECLEFQWGSERSPFSLRRPGAGVLLVDPRTERIRGLQAVGPTASNLVDLVSLGMDREMTLSQFQEQDFCYNPPLTGMWHPLYLAARSAEKRVMQNSIGRYGR